MKNLERSLILLQENNDTVNFEEFMKCINKQYQDNPIVHSCIDSYLNNKEEITFMDCLTIIITALIGANIRLENRLTEEKQNNILHRPILIPISDMRELI